MNFWRLKGFIKDNGVNIVREWCDDQDTAVWEAFVGHAEYLSQQPPSRWVRHWVGTLSGGKKTRKSGCAGLIEWRFDVGNVEYRPLGYYSGEMEFTLLFFAIENGGKFVPPNACETAKQRMSIVIADRRRAHEFSL